jgi:hypothetical protein
MKNKYIKPNFRFLCLCADSILASKDIEDFDSEWLGGNE